MRFLIRTTVCSHGAPLSKHPLPWKLWLEPRLTVSPALRRKRPWTSPGGFSTVPAPVSGRLSPSGLLTCRAMAVTHTPVAFASSSAASAPPSGTLKTEEGGQSPASVPLEDVSRILRLAHPERWRLTGKHPEN